MDTNNKKNKNSKPKEAYFLVDYNTDSGNNIQLYFHVGEDGDGFVNSINEDDIPRGEKVYRVSDMDFVVYVNKQKAKRVGKKKTYLQQAGGKPAYISGIRKNEVYLTNYNLTKINDGDNRISPFNILVDKYLKDVELLGRTGHQTVFSVVIRGENNVVVSWIKSTNGEYIKDAYTVMVVNELDDIDELKVAVFESFKAKMNKSLNENDESIHYEVITEIELLKYTSTTKSDYYPIPEEFLKVRKDLVSLGIVSVSSLLALSTFVYEKNLSGQENKLRQHYSQLKNKKPDVESFKREKIQNHLSYFINKNSVDFTSDLVAAESLWLKNSRLNLISDKDKTIINLYSVDSDGYQAKNFIDKIHNQEAPEGFTKGDILSKNNYTSFELTYKKER